MKKRTGRVIRILSNTEILINIGSSQGANYGDEFEIYEPGEEIVDPSNGRELGSLDYIKSTVEITELKEHFSVAEKIIEKERVKHIGMSAMSALNYGTKTEKVRVVSNIPVNESQISSRKIRNREISINDPVRSKY